MNTQIDQQPDPSVSTEELQINVALLVDRDYLYRFRSIFAHMLVGLVDQPINVILVCPDPIAAASLPIGPAKVVEFKVPFWPWQYRSAMHNLVAELRAAKVNLIHSCSGRPCWLATDLARELKIPYVVTFTGLFQEECYARLDHRYCNRLIGITTPICDTLKDIYGKFDSRIELIRPGCFLRPRTAGIDQPKTIVSFGEFGRHTGYDVLLKALAEVRNRGLECWAILFGRGSMENNLRRWANQNGLGKTVTFLEPLAGWEEVLADADFYVQPGPFYTLQSGPYEAMAHGCPLITTQDSAFDLLFEAKTGLRYKTGNPIHLANILTIWLEKKMNWQEMSDNVLTMAKKDLSLAQSIEKLIDCYRAALMDAHV